jgi:RHS repeat-associated protein
MTSYFPYGEERTSTPDGTEKFGTYYRDGPGQDYAQQRYYNNGTGRFWSVDPGGIGTADPSNPTSLNRYAYVNGDPVNFFDRYGQIEQAPGATDCIADPDYCEAYDWGCSYGGLGFFAWGCVTGGYLGPVVDDGEEEETPTCDPGFTGNADIDYAARVVYAESSGNPQEDVDIADVIVNRLNSKLFGSPTTLTAVVSAPGQFNAVGPPQSKQFFNSGPGQYQNLDPQDCAALTLAIVSMSQVASGGATATYNMFRKAGGHSGTTVGGSVFWTQGSTTRTPTKKKPPTPLKKKPLEDVE